MKKFLRIIGILLLIIIAGVLILGAIAPKEMKTERSVVINAPKDVVAQHMLQYKNFNHWNPWAPMDPNMKSEVIGEEGVTGTKYQWTGNKQVGKGEMVVKSATADEVQYEMHFMEPWESTADGTWRVEDAGNGQTKAIWGFRSDSKFPMNGLMMLMGMEKMLAADFDKGLNKLKAYSEAHANDGASAGDFKIQQVQFPGHTYAAIRKTIANNDMDAMHKFFSESYSSLGKAAGDRINGPASNIVYKWDEGTHTADMAAAFPVSGGDPVQGASMVNVGPSKSYMVVYIGGYAGSIMAHEALSKYVTSKSMMQTMVIEEYLKGPGEEKDSTKWVTNIYYLVP